MMMPTTLSPIIALGLMSGTSLDGLDMALCEFQRTENRWRYRVLKAETAPYEEAWRQQLNDAENLSARDFMLLDRQIGKRMAEEVNRFLENAPARPVLIASHGQTIFHQPEIGLTVQIGSGAEIATRTGISTICDFRTADVALGGQGAPLVPIGDELLFSQYDGCLNLGGFSNISFSCEHRRVAFDIAPCNMLLNTLAQKKGLSFDKGGLVARNGYIFRPLLTKLNELAYYQAPWPKSLGKEWFLQYVWPLFQDEKICVEDALRTATEHIATQIGKTLEENKIKSVLTTGGGTKNSYLMDCIRAKAPHTMVVIPDELTVDFKEAIIFAFLGVLRLQGDNNCLCQVTGAERDNCGGALWAGK